MYLNGEDLLRYWNEIESVGLRKFHTIAILSRKWRLLTSEQQTLRRACPIKWQKTADMKKLRHCHPMYMPYVCA